MVAARKERRTNVIGNGDDNLPIISSYSGLDPGLPTLHDLFYLVLGCRKWAHKCIKSIFKGKFDSEDLQLDLRRCVPGGF